MRTLYMAQDTGRKLGTNRFYISEVGWWASYNLKLKHDGTQALSDHDPIVLSFSTGPGAPAVGGLEKTSPFKASPYVLKSAESRTKLKLAWEQDKEKDTDPHLRFHNACVCLRAQYKTLQRAPKDAAQEVASLRDKLQGLKVELATECLQSTISDWAQTEDLLWNLEELDILQKKWASRIRWLGPSSCKVALSTVHR